MRKPYAGAVLALAMLAASLVHAQQREPANQDASKTKSTFLVVYKPGSAWLPGKPVSEQPLREHGKYMLKLYTDGVLKFAGPFTDNAGGAVVFEAADEAEAKSIVANDPAVVSRVFVHELHPWGLVQWERFLKK